MTQLQVQSDGHEEHGHDHPEFLGHHWKNPVQQFEAGKLGMWLFLATEVLLFGGLFCAYAIWRSNHPEIFKYGSQFLDTTWGAINTGVLLVSSMTMAMAVTFAARGNNRAVIVTLILTLFGAAGFMAIKYVEYNHKFHEGFYPGMAFYEQPHASELWLPLEETAIAKKAAIAQSEAAASTALAAEDVKRSEMPSPPAEAQDWNKPKAAIGPQGLTTNQESLDTAEMADLPSTKRTWQHHRSKRRACVCRAPHAGRAGASCSSSAGPRASSECAEVLYDLLLDDRLARHPRCDWRCCHLVVVAQDHEGSL